MPCITLRKTAADKERRRFTPRPPEGPFWPESPHLDRIWRTCNGSETQIPTRLGKLVAGGRIVRIVNCIGSPELSRDKRHVSAQRAAAASRFERRRAGAADGTVIPPGQIAARLAWSTAKSSTLNPPALRLFRLHSAWKGASSVNITDCSNKLPGYWRVIDSLRSCLSAPVRWRFPKD